MKVVERALDISGGGTGQQLGVGVLRSLQVGERALDISGGGTGQQLGVGVFCCVQADKCRLVARHIGKVGQVGIEQSLRKVRPVFIG